jgi:RNA polymerase sigma factor (sigma-70 family)
MDMRRRNQGAEPAEIEAVYRARVADFRRVATAIIGDPERGSDAVQDAFGTALRRRRMFRGEAPLEAWLWRLVVNQARDERRAARRAPDPSARLQPTRGNGSGSSDDARLAIAIAALPERQRLAVFLRYYADLDYASIAVALGIQPGTVAASLNTAHATLRRTLQEALR